MKCENVIQSFLNEEDGRYLSILTRLHIALCPDCRREICRMQKIFAEARSASAFRMPDDISDLIMWKVSASGVTHEENVSSFKWILTGVIIWLSIFMVSYSDSFIWLKDHFGSSIEISLNIVLGFAITLYAASYIGTHIDGMKKLVDFINHKIH